jgi:hypothetical protein
MYDIKTGRREMRGGKPIPRGPKLKTPCWECPKNSPEEESQHVLSDKNRQLLALYYEIKATHGRCMTDRLAADPLLRHKLAIVGRIVEDWERHEAKMATAPIAAVLAMFTGGKKR